MRKCIYCNTEDGLSESDIIPDSMTNVRILNKNVCSELHNKPFSIFENKVFEDFSYIINKLDIRSQKKKFGDLYPEYNAEFEIDGDYYKAKVASNNDLKTRKINLEVGDKKIIIDKGNAKKIVKEKNTGEIKVENLNKPPLIKNSRTTIEQHIFITPSISRLMCKIAFEWYCRENNVNEKREEFSEIINYITTGAGNPPVKVIQDMRVYEFIDNMLDPPGYHRLICFLDDLNSVNVYISFFDLIIYHVLVSTSVPEGCDNNLLYLELGVDGNKYSIAYSSIKEFAEKCNSMFNENISSLISDGRMEQTEDKLSVYVANDNQASIFNDFSEYNKILKFVDILLKVSKENDVYISKMKKLNDTFLYWITGRLKFTLQVGVVHLRKLKHFVAEHSLCDETKINIYESTPSEMLNLFYLFKIGEMNKHNPVDKIDKMSINEIAKSLPYYDMDDGHIALTKDYAESLKKCILKYDGYCHLIHCGAMIIKNS